MSHLITEFPIQISNFAGALLMSLEKEQIKNIQNILQSKMILKAMFGEHKNLRGHFNPPQVFFNNSRRRKDPQ